jgi:hypothetical protein
MTRQLNDNLRRHRWGWRAVAAAALTAAVLGSVGGVLASARASSPVRARASGARQVTAGLLTEASRTPAGFAPVTYRDAQLSVPRMWLVESPGQFSCVIRAPGLIFAGAEPKFPAGTGCHLTASLAWIRPAGHIPPGLRHQPPTTVINGIPVYRLHSAHGSVLYLAPKLGVRVGARGKLARRVLRTLTWSPLAAVLRHGPAAQVPASWIRHRFGGIGFSVPASWQVLHQKQWATCGTGLVPGSLLLIDAVKPPLALPCPLLIPTAVSVQAQPGLTVVTGKYAARSVAEKFPDCRLRHGAEVCLSSVTGQGGLTGGVLIFSVSRPDQRARTFFLLGLPGSGASPRAVFDSVRVARS